MTKKEFYEDLQEYSNNDYVLINNIESGLEKIIKVKKVDDDLFDWSDYFDDDHVEELSIKKVIEIEDNLYEDDWNIYKTDFVFIPGGIDFEKVISSRSKY